MLPAQKLTHAQVAESPIAFASTFALLSPARSVVIFPVRRLSPSWAPGGKAQFQAL